MTPEQAIRERAAKRRVGHFDTGWVPVWRQQDVADIDALLALVDELRAKDASNFTVEPHTKGRDDEWLTFAVRMLAYMEREDVTDGLEAEFERLQGIVDELRAERETLPRFADDVIAYPGMKGWYPGEEYRGTVNETGLTCGNEDWGVGTEECFSTRKAAEEARG